MDGGGAYGGGKAGAPFDPIAFVQRPLVILRALCLVSLRIITNFNFPEYFLSYILIRRTKFEMVNTLILKELEPPPLPVMGFY